MENNRGPVLVVGLGGIGCSIVDSLAGMLPEEMKEYVAVVGVDFDIADLRKRENIVPVKIGLNSSLEKVLDRYPEYRKYHREEDLTWQVLLWLHARCNP